MPIRTLRSYTLDYMDEMTLNTLHTWNGWELAALEVE